MKSTHLHLENNNPFVPYTITYRFDHEQHRQPDAVDSSLLSYYYYFYFYVYIATTATSGGVNHSVTRWADRQHLCVVPDKLSTRSLEYEVHLTSRNFPFPR